MNEKLHLKIRAIARDLFMAIGYESVGMREIAAALGLQPTQIYRLNLTKVDILAEVIIELNSKVIDLLPALLESVTGKTSLERTCSYLLMLYRIDIEHIKLRSVGAMYGWSWNPRYESIVVAQVKQLLAPIAAWLAEDGYDDLPARCYGIWSLYYVGYRRAVIQGCDAQECLNEIHPSLKILLPTAHKL